ncbi:MAG: UDP-3-O-(3-hydroxymyristoyl)glucosamine N-acyltransferase [Verrucomicrobia bacterium]|nr:UDP-3-O-(3-hydroxymyristoyl)glucosamine N-acyltransferase [Verrucomicrobiota bacterium]
MRALEEIAKFIGGEMRGDGSVSVARVVHPAVAQGASDLAFVLSSEEASVLSSGRILNAVVPAGIENLPIPNQIVVSRPRLVLAKLTEFFERPVHVAAGIHPWAAIDPTASVGEGTSIGPFCWVGPNSRVGARCRLVANVNLGAEVTIGEDSLLHAGVCIGDRCEIGSRVTIQPNATIGGDGFAFVTPEPGSVESVRKTGEVRNFNTHIVRINSLGNVVIEDDVEIGAGTCVDRGTLGETRIGHGSKLDNLIQVGHNTRIGSNCLIVAQVGLGGSSTVGDRVVLGGQSGVPDHVSLGADAVIYARSGIVGPVPEKAAMIGIPALPLRQFMEQEVKMRRLPNLIKDLQRQMASLEEKLNSLFPPK